jgi:cysteine desulfurase
MLCYDPFVPGATMPPIYLDYNATTPVDPLVTESISHALRELWGNPSSAHEYGQGAHAAVEKARTQIAQLLGASPGEIVFTGGGSEASNHAIKGVCLTRPRGLFAKLFASDTPHIITSAVEHPATTQPIDFLRKLGCSATTLDVDGTGLVNPDEVRKAITPRTKLVTIMHSNNEVGTLMPIAEIGKICRERGVLFHTDCAQSLGKVRVDVNELNVDLLTVAGHKLYAPKGVGALFVRRGLNLEPLIHGAGHESNRRAGTENTPYIVGLGRAAELARESLSTATEKLRQMRDRLHQKLLSSLGEKLSLNGHIEKRLPNTLNVNFHGHNGGELLKRTPGLAASTGSACHEKGKEWQSAILCAMKVDPKIGIGAVRLTVGRWTTEQEVDEAAELLAKSATS